MLHSIIVVFVTLHVACPQDAPVVVTLNGPVKGYIRQTERDGTLYAGYVGIPFAKPPVGQRRFKSPEPAEPWSDVLDATKETPSCYEFLLNIAPSEDCLHLNIFTPMTNRTDQLKAVMIFLYGGAYIVGSSHSYGYHPGFFMDYDVIFVTLNYRLGSLGFLSLQNEDVPGNAGLKDALLGLKWIADNIKNFGGDPEKITLFGESAGATSTNLLQLSNQVTGLINNVILESGVGFNHVAEPEEALLNAFRLGNELGCDISQSDEDSEELLLACLQNTSASQLMNQNFLNGGILSSFGPVIEPDVPDAVVRKDPLEILESGEFDQLDMIIGVNTKEGLLFYPYYHLIDPDGNLTFEMGQNLTHFIPNELEQIVNQTQAAEIETQIRDFYFDGQNVTLDRRPLLVDLSTDSRFVIPAQRTTVLTARNSKAKIYNYLFSYDGPFNMYKIFTLTNMAGAAHVDELGYLMDPIFLRPLYNAYARNSTPQVTIDRMTKMWTNFAKYGTPTPELDESILTTDWKPFTLEEHNYLDIGEELELKQGLFKERLHFWNNIYEGVMGERPLPE